MATIVCEDILRSAALVLGVNILVALAKENGGLHFIAIGEVFLQLVNRSIIL